MEYREKEAERSAENGERFRERKEPSGTFTKRNKIALVTGASSGMGKEFVREISDRLPWLDEIWAVARNREALDALQEEVPVAKIRKFALDITKKEDRETLKKELETHKPAVRVFVASAGAGIQKKVEDTPLEELENMTELNCTALTSLTALCLPYCKKNGRIILMSSAAAFLPQPGFAVYAATKAYVLSFARALRRELKGQASVTVVCPGPVDTAFLEKMGGREQMPSYKKHFIARPEAVVRKAMRDSARGKEMSVYGMSMKSLRLLSRAFPQRVLLNKVQSREESEGDRREKSYREQMGVFSLR